MSGAPTIIVEKRHKRVQRWRLRWIAERAARRPPFQSDEGERAVGTFAGTLPGPDPEREGTVLVACDRTYLESFAGAFLRSVDATGKPTRVHVHVCDDADGIAERMNGLSSPCPNLALSWTAGVEAGAEALAYRTIYYTAARFLIAPAILRSTRGPVLCLDIDALARRPLWPPINEALGDADLVVQERPEWKQATRRTVAGVVAFAASDGGLTFADRLAGAIRRGFGIDPRYHLDQITMTYLLAIMRRHGELRTAPVPDGYVDHAPGGDGVLWSAKGWEQKGSAAFRNASAVAQGAA